jgi:N-acetylglucosaminyldiphosphoundecaprenol N-acetyl-beta-D-mannosaminyltransferase
MEDPSIQRLSLGGIRMDALRESDLLSLVRQTTPGGDRLLILNHNLHSLYLFHTDPAFKKAYSKASWVYIDGLPIVWIGQIAGLPLTASNRITLLDSFPVILAEAERSGLRVFYLGSTEEALTAGIASLRKRYPQLVIRGRNGFFYKSEADNAEVISQINEFRADILFVGMGMPMQETWLAEHHAKLEVSITLTSGATLDYVAGHAYRPPAWAGRLGLYGVFRLLSDPRRLWRRYLLEPLVVLRYTLRPLIRQRRYAEIARGDEWATWR